MPKGPKDAPLGAKPVLPAPTSTATKRAHTLMEQLVDLQRPGTKPAPLSPPVHASHPRTYDVAHATLQALEAQYNEQAVLDEATMVDAPSPQTDATATIDDDAVTKVTTTPEPLRPPAGAAAIRPSPPPPKASAIDQGVLERLASGAMLRCEADGSRSFDIAFKDDVFEKLSCRINLCEGVVRAVFLVANNNLRRLLESESGHLRVLLEKRGMRVASVTVEVADVHTP